MAYRRSSLAVVGVAVLAISVCLAGGVYVKRLADARDRVTISSGELQALAVRTIDIEPKAVPLSFEVRGFLRGFEEVTVHAEVDGQVMGKFVDEGQTVRKGQKLFELDRTFRRLTVKQLSAAVTGAREQQRQAKAGLDVARAQVAEAEAAQQNALNEYERIKRIEKQGHTMPVEVDRITAHKRQCDARMRMASAAMAAAVSKKDAADAALALAEAQLEEAGERLKRCVIGWFLGWFCLDGFFHSLMGSFWLVPSEGFQGCDCELVFRVMDDASLQGFDLFLLRRECFYIPHPGIDIARLNPNDLFEHMAGIIHPAGFQIFNCLM